MAPRRTPIMDHARSLSAQHTDSSLDALASQLPDLVMSMRRDGAIVQSFGGARLPVVIARDVDGLPQLNLSADAHTFLRQTVKRALAERAH